MSVGKVHFELHLAGESIVEPAPGVQAVHIEIGGQRLHLRAHLMLTFVAQTLHAVLGVLQRGISEEKAIGLLTAGIK